MQDPSFDKEAAAADHVVSINEQEVNQNEDNPVRDAVDHREGF